MRRTMTMTALAVVLVAWSGNDDEADSDAGDLAVDTRFGGS